MDLFFSGDNRPRGTRQGLPVAVSCAAILFGALAPAALSAEVSPALRDRIAVPTVADATFPVIATLTEQVDSSQYAGRRADLIAAMKRTAAQTQPQVVSQLDATATRYWLVNAVAVDATRDEIAALEQDPRVKYVDLDRVGRIADTGPTLLASPPFASAGRGNWGLGTVRAPQAWTRFRATGAGVVVGSIDTGVDAGNPDLAGKVVAFRDFINGVPDAYDDNGHGTHTIGTMIGGRAGGAPIGVAPDARVVVAKAADANGTGPGSALLAAAQWMTDPDGDPATADQPVVVNNSWTAPDANDPWFREMVRQWLALGIVPVFATGNNGPAPGSVGSPAGYPEVLAVGAADPAGEMTEFTARGPVRWANADGTGPAAGTVLIKPDLLAPGVNITSSVGTGYLSSTGTSMAAPHVSGAIALIAQANPAIRGTAAIDLLKRTAVDRGAAGPDAEYGGGQLDIEAAVAAAVGAPASSPVSIRIAATRRAARPGRVAVNIRISGANAYRLRVNGKRWSAPRTAKRVVLTLSRGRQVVEARTIATRPGTVAKAARTIIRVGLPSPTAFSRR